MQEADAVALGSALGNARDGEGLGPIAAGSDGHDVSVSNGQHVVVSIVGMPNPPDYRPHVSPAADESSGKTNSGGQDARGDSPCEWPLSVPGRPAYSQRSRWLGEAMTFRLSTVIRGRTVMGGGRGPE